MTEDVAIRRVESQRDRDDWHELAERSDAAALTQCLWWAEPLERCGVKAQAVGVWRGERLVGGALFRSIPLPLPGARLTQCEAGPLGVEWRSEWADVFAARIAELAGEHASLEVSLRGCRSPRLHADLVDALRRREGGRVELSPGASDAVIPLEGITAEEAVRRMKKETRRCFRVAEKSGIRVVALKDPADLDRADAAWRASAQRKGFAGELRPWRYLKPVVRRCVERGLGAVLASVKDSEILAATFVTFMGGQAFSVYGGFVDGAQRYAPNHAMDLEAIRLAVGRGLTGYNLGTLSSSVHPGVDAYKLSLGARPMRRLDTIVWKRSLLLAASAAWLRRRPAGRRIVARMRRRLLEQA